MRLHVLAVAVLATGLAVSPAAARVWQQDWKVGAHPVVHVATNDGHVRIHRGAPGQVSAVVEYTLKLWGVHAGVKAPEIELARNGDSITVTARTHDNVVVVIGGSSEAFKIDVTLPPECDVRVRSGDGAVECEPVTGAVDLETGDGRITAHGARGHVRLWTGDGGIDADGLDGVLEARSGDGHLHVAGRFDRLDLRSGDGRIEATVLPGSRLADAWSLASGDGGVTLRVPRDLKAVLDVVAHDGGVHVDLPISGRESLGHHEIRGQLNGGTVPLRIRSGDGSVRLALSE